MAMHPSEIGFALRDRLRSLGYDRQLRELSAILPSGLWVMGGWVRSIALREHSYFGDIDCLTDTPRSAMTDELNKAGIPYLDGPRGNVRIAAMDGNTVDVSNSSSYREGGSVRDALETFNFSVNAGAVLINDNSFTSSTHFLNDVRDRKVRANPARISEKGGLIKAMEAAETLCAYYGLTMAEDEASSALAGMIVTRKRAAQSMTLEDLVRRAKAELSDVLNRVDDAWIVRGAVRAALLGQLEYWDDLDVIVGCARDKVVNLVREAGLRFSISYFGYPKILCDDGGTIDIWGLPEGESLERHFASYAHDVDAVALHVQTSKLVDPMNTQLRLRNRQMDLTAAFYDPTYTERAAAYAAVKAVYLVIRHGFEVSQRTQAVLTAPIRLDGHVRRLGHKLSEELFCIQSWPSALRELSRFTDRADDSVIAFFEKNLQM